MTTSVDPVIAPESRVTIERDGKRIVVHSSYRDKDLINQVPGSTWDRKNRVWKTRLSWSALVQLREIFGDRIDIGDELKAWHDHKWETQIYPCLALRDAEDIPDWDTKVLYPRQKVGVSFLVHAKNAILGDEVGAGKTRQVLAALEWRQTFPVLIVANKSAKDSWVEEIDKLKAEGVIPQDRTVQVIGGTAKKRREQLATPADIYIIHWALLRYHSRLAGYGYIKLTDEEKEDKELNMLPLRAVVVDEAHRMQDPKAKQTRAVWALGDALPENEETARLAMTGTLITKNIESAWPICRFVEPDEFPSKTAFIERYAMQVWTPFGFNEIAGLDPKYKAEFFQIFDPRFIRRPTKVVVPWLPDPIRVPPRKVELGTKQKKAYKNMRDGLLAEVDGGVLFAKNPLVQLTRLRQLAAAYGEIDEDGNMRLTEPSAVIDETVAALQDLGEMQAIVFAESRQLIELLSARLDKEGIDHGLITGLINEEDRTARRRAFQDGRLRVLCLTVGAGGESLTLTNARAMIFMERPFGLVPNIQAEGRGVRPGQEERILIIDIEPTLGTDKEGDDVPTIYSHVREVVVEKQLNAEEVMRDSAWLTKVLS